MTTIIEWNAASATPFATRLTIFTRRGRIGSSSSSLTQLSISRWPKQSRSIVLALDCGTRKKQKARITTRLRKQITNAAMAAVVVDLKMNRFALKLAANSLSLRRTRTEILQVNVGKLCNLTCMHCHVNAGPKRKEIMSRETIDRVIDWLGKTDIAIVDLTGGAPEMIPDFRFFIQRVKELQPARHVIDRCNLTILVEPGYEDLGEFLATNKVEIIASMPCYSAENVNAQRGEGVFEGSITALQLLNSLGYGTDPDLPLHLIYNPVGAFLPPSQAELEADYKRELKKHL